MTSQQPQTENRTAARNRIETPAVALQERCDVARLWRWLGMAGFLMGAIGWYIASFALTNDGRHVSAAAKLGVAMIGAWLVVVLSRWPTARWVDRCLRAALPSGAMLVVIGFLNALDILMVVAPPLLPLAHGALLAAAAGISVATLVWLGREQDP
jgi:hypothetical protein